MMRLPLYNYKDLLQEIFSKDQPYYHQNCEVDISVNQIQAICSQQSEVSLLR